MNKNSPFVLLVLQATPYCNLDCTYCYLPNRSDKGKFDLSLIPIIMENLQKSKLINDTIKINWHAGEPTVLNTEYYTEAIDLFKKHNTLNINIEHSFQTNATLLTPKYCEFIKKNNIAIGVSIDGPMFINDRNRIFRNNNGSFEKTIKGISLLNDYGIEFSVISVLTEFSLDYPIEIFNFLRSIKAKSVGFNVEEKEGCHKTTTMDSSNVVRYKKFFETFNKLILESGLKIQQREYIKSLNSIIYQSENFKNGLVTPLSTITIGINGEFTVFAPELLTFKDDKYGDYIFGNVKNNLFHEIYENPKFIKIYNEIKEGVKMCEETCDFFGVCGGGSPSNKLHENGTFASTETNYCRYNIKIPIEIVLNDLGQ